MKAKTIQILGVAAIVALAGGVLAQRLGDRSSSNDRAGAPALPALQDTVNDVRTVTIESGGETLTFERSDDGWTVPEKGGWAAKPEKVRSLVLALRELEVVEEKTSDASRFDRLGLVEPSGEGATSKRITLRGEGGDALVSMLVGDRRASKGGMGAMAMGGGPGAMHYVFAGDEGDPALLVSGDLVADTRLTSWLDTTLLNIPRDRFGAARFTWGDGETLEIVPDPSEEDGLMITEAPEGKESKGTVALNPARTALAGLRFDDVARAEDIDFEGASRATAEFFTEHGLKVTVETVELPSEGSPDETRVWARFSAAHAPDASPAPAAADEPAVEGSEEPSDEGAADGEVPSPEELADEAAELEARLSGWAFALPQWKTKALRMRTADVVQDVPPPLAPVEVPGVDGDGGEQQPPAVPEGDGGEETPADPAPDPAPGAPGGTGGGGGGE